MVFSFFKKDPKDAKKVTGGRGRPAAAGSRPSGGTEVTTRPSAKPIGRPLDGPNSRIPGGTRAPDSVVPERERARMTAAKIDEIEAQMARDLLGRPTRTTVPGGPATQPLNTLPGGPTTMAATTASAPATEPHDPIEVNSAILAGNIDAIEITETGGGSVIDETAILFANGEVDAAETVLRAGLRGNDLGAAARMAWHMLFEIVNDRGDRAAFEQLAMDYALRFEHSPPAWIDYDETPATRPGGAAPARQAVDEGNSVRLPPSIDAGIVAHLEKLRALTATHARVQLDVSDAAEIDLGGAGMLLRVIGAFRRSDRELTLAGADVLAGVLSRSVESGRRDPSDALWMLLLEMQRMLGRNEEFEETAIQYCITFEVSPPSWEPAPRSLKTAPATAAPVAAAAAEAAPTGSPLELRGTVSGDGEPNIGRLITAARGQQQVVIDCQQLRRLSFSAGSGLLGAVRKIRQGGCTVELRNVSAIVAALLNLLGVAALARLQQRYE